MTHILKYLIPIPKGMKGVMACRRPLTEKAQSRPVKAAEVMSDVEQTLRKAGTAVTSGPAKGMQKAPRDWRVGTCLQGQIKDTSYNELRYCFGEPHYSDMTNDQITKEWVITIEGVVCTIYDWRRGRTPLRDTVWNVGGTSKLSARLVESYLYKWRTDCLGITAAY